MPTKVVELDLKDPRLAQGGFDGYDAAFVLLRYGGRPVGQLRVPVVTGRLNVAEIHETIFRGDAWPIWTRVVQEYVQWEAEESPSHRPRATAVAITRERPEDLRRCLDALMKLPDDGQEVLVVDNRPVTEVTRDLVQDYSGRVRYVREDRPGSSAARNRALREARHEIVAFTDDDAVVDAGWLRALVRNFRDPRVLCVTGLVAPLELETPDQEEFERFSPHGRGYRREVFSQVTHYALHAAPVGVSANMALRREVLETVGGFDEALGVGTPSRCGEDYELFARILTSGYQIVYDPAALNWHRHRRSHAELRDTLRGYGVGVYACWTRMLLTQREPSVALMALRWFWHRQLPEIIQSVRRKDGYTPLDLLLAQLAGCLAGPWAYLRSRRQLARRGAES
jgi:GT2 family glycosyltransferase